LGNAAPMRSIGLSTGDVDKQSESLRRTGNTIVFLGTGADIANESVQVTLVKGDLRGIVRARTAVVPSGVKSRLR
jgi:hypothetical protein